MKFVTVLLYLLLLLATVADYNVLINNSGDYEVTQGNASTTLTSIHFVLISLSLFLVARQLPTSGMVKESIVNDQNRG